MHIHKNKLLSNRLDKYQSQHKDDSKSSSASSMITNILVPTVIDISSWQNFGLKEYI